MRQYTIFGIGLLAALLSGCQQDNDLKSGYGYLQLSSVEVDKNIQTKAGEQLALDIYDSSNTLLKHADDWTTMQSESLLLLVGDYTLKAYSATGSAEAQGFDAIPYYMGEQVVTVEANVAKTAEVTCTLAQAKVEISYSDRFKSVFPTYATTVSNTKGHIDFAADETRSAFVCAGEALNATVTFAKADGATKTYSHVIAATAQPKYLYKVAYDINNVPGTGEFTVTVNITVDRYELNATVPLESNIDDNLQATSANAWGQFAYLYGSSLLTSTSEPYVFEFKKNGATEWTSVPATLVDGQYTAKTGQLEFNTAYNYRLVNGTKVSATQSFTTEAYEEIPNLNFDTWTQSGKNWYANPVANNYDDAQAYWATGNEGVTSFLAGGNNPITVPVEGADAYSGKAGKMYTLTGVTLVGAAAGNLFVGRYKTNMSSPANSVTFGRPYTGARPVSLSGYYKYTSQPISQGSYPGTLTNDEGHIYMKLWDAEGNEIAYGEKVITESADTYTPFTFDLVYSNETAKPAKIMILCTSSHYGGEFSGSKVVGQVGSNSTLWVDEFSVSYYK